MPVFTTRPDTLFGATFFVLAPEHPLVERFAERAAERRRAPRVRAARRRARRARSALAREEKTGVFTGFYAINPVNDERDPDLGRRLRADGLRHRRDHGRARARRARLRVRAEVRPADRAGRRARRRRGRGGRRVRRALRERGARQLGRSSRGMPAPGGEAGDRRRGSSERGRGKPGDQLPPARLAALAAALLGLPDPDVHCERCGDRAGARGRAAGAAARDRRLPAEGPLAARGRGGLGAT